MILRDSIDVHRINSGADSKSTLFDISSIMMREVCKSVTLKAYNNNKGERDRQ